MTNTNRFARRIFVPDSRTVKARVDPEYLARLQSDTEEHR